MKKTIKGITLGILFLFLLLNPITINAEELLEEEGQENVEVPELPEETTGEWVEQNGEKYYYENGEPISGFKTIDGNTYFFGITTHKLLHGWQDWYGRFYLDSDGKVTEGWNEIDGEKYYVRDHYVVNKWQEIDGNWYFFGLTTYKLLHGWQDWNGRFYLDSEGKVTEGLNIIDGEKYYVKDHYMVNKWQEIDGNWYFFGLSTYKMLHGWQDWNGRFYLDSEGKAKEGLNIIDGEKYFVKDHYLANKWQEIDGNWYFFGLTTYKMLHGWQDWNGRFYLDSEGKATEGWNDIDGERYYVRDHYMVKGFQTIDGATYFFGITKYFLLHGWQDWNGRFYAEETTGEVKQGWHDVGDKTYYTKDNYIVKGKQEIEGKQYYFDTTGAVIKKSSKTNTREYHINEETWELLKLQYIPVYYNQKDIRWGNLLYNGHKFGSTGCVPTSLAMAYTSILDRQILPNEIGNYLYYNTDQFNKKLSGASGMAIIKASEYYHVKVEPIYTKEQLVEHLKAGKIVYASMQNGKFATPTWNHAIIMYDYKDDKAMTYASDPLQTVNNGYVDVDLIWREKNTDPDDTSGGSAIYALSEF